ncbi:ligase-associated DNA damage response exonuclease [Longimicrobium sp.]|uniref:ligase-associated DNA damage response exonuclease n=1 Tax=Longimicrobium sp. TaxID=2029185 RepID=UPI002CDDAE91|nr:ligase-associated DNA damage response exonuclease [Longimicrobium sp.]HSU14263.1 ligase-associated DNA damage response exonuclease [Longimicrobium sp.]
MLMRITERGLYCDAGDFHVDPWMPVERAVITHAHGDHARWGSRRYLGSREGERVMRTRLGHDASIRAVDWGEPVEVNGVRISLHPAGHILGSAQVRVEHRGEVWVVSGDYKTEPDPTCTPFEPVACHTFVTESTFGLPIYRWSPDREVFAGIDAWWRANQEAGKASLIYGYALGKAQRLLAGVDPQIGPIYEHGAVARLTRDYRDTGVALPPTEYAGAQPRGHDWSRALIVAPPSAHGTPWMRTFGAVSTAFASGWMRVRGQRRRRSVDRGFVLSDHVDWPSLLAAIEATGAGRVWVTHGYREPVVRWLRQRGIEAQAVASRWEGDEDAGDVEIAPEAGEAGVVDSVAGDGDAVADSMDGLGREGEGE